MRPLLLAPLLLAPTLAVADDEVDLLVVVAVDGLGWANVERYEPWFTSGLKRLLDEGQVEAGASYRHLNAETGPGHASLATGAPPTVHGVVGNRWFVDDGRGGLRAQYCADEVDPAGVPRISASTLAVDTLADRLVAAHQDARVVSFAGKDRAAALLAGRHPGHAPYWYDKKTGTFVSSSAWPGDGDWQRATRALVDGWNGASAGPQLALRFDPMWQPLPPPVGAADLPQPARALVRWQSPDLGVGFDHDLRRYPRGWLEAVYASPILDVLVVELAEAALRSDAVGLGRGGAPDVLALSFSAHDTVSHPFGSESEEELDVLRRLDAHLGRLLAALDALQADGVRVALALSADHGFAPLPEVVRRDTKAPWGGRLPWVDESWEHQPNRAEAFWSAAHPTAAERLDRAVGEALCLPAGTHALHGMEGLALAYAPWPEPVTTTRRKGCRRTVTHADVDRVLPGVVATLLGEEIEAVLLASQQDRWPDGAVAEHAGNASFPGRSGDAFLIPRPGVIVAYDPARGSTHGSHHAYDQRVPLIFWGPDFPAARRTTPSAPYDLAPTLAGLVDVTLPQATGTDRRAR